MYTKHYLSIYYGIDESLPNDIFYSKIAEINKLAAEITILFTRGTDDI